MIIRSKAPQFQTLIMAAGQSNIDGSQTIATLQDQYKKPFPHIRFYDPAANEFNTMDYTVPKTFRAPNTTSIFAIQFSLYTKLQARLGNINVFQYAVGGTALNDAGATGWKSGVGGTLYDTMITKYGTCRTLLRAGQVKNYRVPFMYWAQGEGDSANATNANAYNTNLTTLINNTRIDTGLFGLPFIIPLINSNINTGTFPNWSTVRTAQLAVAAALPKVYTVNPDSCELAADGVHYTPAGYEALSELVYQCAISNNLI